MKGIWLCDIAHGGPHLGSAELNATSPVETSSMTTAAIPCDIKIHVTTERTTFVSLRDGLPEAHVPRRLPVNSPPTQAIVQKTTAVACPQRHEVNQWIALREEQQKKRSKREESWWRQLLQGEWH